MAAKYKNAVNLISLPILILFFLYMIFKGTEILPLHSNLQIPSYKRTISSNGTKYNKAFLITFANIPGWLRERTKTMNFQECKFSNCRVTDNQSYISESDVLLFHGPDISPTPPKRSVGQIWIFVDLESPHFSNSNYKKTQWRRAFNWTMTYRNDSDIIFRYGMVFASNKTDHINYTNIITNKKKPVAWVVSHCNVPSNRDKYVRELKKYIEVDIYGKCGKLKCGSSDFMKCYEEIGHRYQFYLSFENSICKDYYTEKVYNVYSPTVYMIPVVRGAVGYEKYFPKGTYIFTGNFSSPKALANYLKTMSESEYQKMLKKKLQFDSTMTNNDGIYHRALCNVCEKLNTNHMRYSKNVDINDWLWNNTCIELKDF